MNTPKIASKNIAKMLYGGYGSLNQCGMQKALNRIYLMATENNQSSNFLQIYLNKIY